ncbi:MAG: HU family DNA-binding protein, partial [Acidimicrobiales bacterium]
MPKKKEVTMNKSELVQEVSKQSGLTRQQAELAIDTFKTVVMREVKAQRRVALMGFGTFNHTKRRGRTGRNPNTGAPLKIAASKGVRFTAGSEFKDVLNKGKALPKPVAIKTAAAKTTATAKKTAAAKTTATAKKTAAAKTTATAKKTAAA